MKPATPVDAQKCSFAFRTAALSAEGVVCASGARRVRDGVLCSELGDRGGGAGGTGREPPAERLEALQGYPRTKKEGREAKTASFVKGSAQVTGPQKRTRCGHSLAEFTFSLATGKPLDGVV